MVTQSFNHHTGFLNTACRHIYFTTRLLLKQSCLPAIVAAAAKLLQSCLTLCDPIDGPLGFAIPGILQARKLEWVDFSFSNRDNNWNLFQNNYFYIFIEYFWSYPYLLFHLLSVCPILHDYLYNRHYWNIYSAFLWMRMLIKVKKCLPGIYVSSLFPSFPDVKSRGIFDPCLEIRFSVLILNLRSTVSGS